MYTLVFIVEKRFRQSKCYAFRQIHSLAVPCAPGSAYSAVLDSILNLFLEQDLDGLNIDLIQPTSRQYTPDNQNLDSRTHWRRAGMCSSKPSESEGSISPPRKHSCG